MGDKKRLAEQLESSLGKYKREVQVKDRGPMVDTMQRHSGTRGQLDTEHSIKAMRKHLEAHPAYEHEYKKDIRLPGKAKR